MSAREEILAPLQVSFRSRLRKTGLRSPTTRRTALAIRTALVRIS